MSKSNNAATSKSTTGTKASALDTSAVTVVLDSNDPLYYYGLYKLSSGNFVIAEPDLVQGDSPSAAIKLVSDSKGTNWSTTATRAGISSFTDAEGNEILGVVTASGKGSSGVYTGQNFSVSGETATLLGKSATLTFQHALALEVLMEQDLSDDGVIGDEIIAVMDEAAGYDQFAGLYKMKSGAYVIGVSGLYEGDVPTTEANAVLTRKDGKAWTTTAKAIAITPVAGEDGKFVDYGVVTSTGSGAATKFSEEIFNWNYEFDAPRAISKGPAVSLTLPQVLQREVYYAQDLNGDDAIGDAIVLVVDESDPFGENGLYKMASGGYAVSMANLGEGETPEGFSLLVADAKGTAWTTKATTVAINAQEDAKGNPLLGVLTVTGEGAKAVYAEELFAANANATQYVSKGKAVTLTLSQVLGKELAYDQDLNGDGDIGDAIASVVDDMDGTEMYGLYKMASGAFAVGGSGLYEGDVPDPAIALVADTKGTAWSTKATPLALNAQTNAKSGADELAVISMTGSGAKVVYVEELFTVSTDQTKATLTGKAVTLTALALAEKEALYGQDLNLDGRIGSPVLMGSPSSGAFVLDGDISYHSVGVGSSTNRPVLEITGADANVVIGTDPSDNTAIMKAQEIYFSGLSVGVPRTGMTMGTASINDSAKLTIYGGLPIPGFKYDIPLDKTFAVLAVGHGKGTNGSLGVESSATVDIESNSTYFGVGCGLGVGAMSISGAGTELNMLADEMGTIQVGCGDQTMGWLGGKGSLAVEDSAKVSLSSKSAFGVSIGIAGGEGLWAISNAEITADVADSFWLGIGQDGAGELRLGSGASFLMSSDRQLGIDLGKHKGKGNLSVEEALWEVNANNLNMNVGLYGGVGALRLDNATVVLGSAPTLSADYDWSGTYVQVGGVGWDGKDSSSIGDALITNGTQLSVVGRHSGISIADGKGSKGKMVVDNGATVLVSSTDANNEYATEDQDLFAFLNVGGTGWGSYGGQGWLEISGAGTQFLISSDSPETGAHASINVGSNGEAGVVVVKAGAALRADVQSSNLRMSSHYDSKAKEGSSFLQISGQDSMVDISYIDAGKDNQALIDISDQGRLNAATINIHLNGILMGNSGLIASNDPAGSSLVRVDGKICVGDQLDLIQRTKTTAFGNLDVDGDVVINQTGRLEFDIGQIADYVNIGGQLDIDGTVTVTSATKLTKGTRYLIATADSIDLSGSKLVTVGTVGTLQLDANSTELYFVVA